MATATASAGADWPSISEGADVAACRTDNGPVLQIDSGILVNAAGRTGYRYCQKLVGQPLVPWYTNLGIVMLLPESYSQFKFDSLPQAGAIFMSCFINCADGSLAVGGFNIFYQDLDRDFFNLYDRS